MILTPLVNLCAHFSSFLFALALFGHQIHLANAQGGSTDVYVYVNETSKWITSGETWTLNKTLGIYASNWLIATRAPNAAAPTTASFTFNGTAVAIFGTVDDGIQNDSLNFSIKIDNGDSVEPTYTPRQLANGLDVNYKIFEQSSLQFTAHTITLTLLGQTTPFYIQGAVYSVAASPTLSMPNLSATSTASPNTNTSGDDKAKLGGAIGGGVGALLLVALVILFMIRRIKRIEQNERKLQARPFTAPPRENSSRVGLTEATPSVRSAPRTSTSGDTKKKKKKFTASSSNPSISEKEKLVRRDGGVSSSSRSHTQSHSRSQSQQTQSYVNSQLQQTQSYHSITQHQLNPRPDVAIIQQTSSPQGSVISLPSEYQAATTIGNRGPGTAVASSYIGPSPLPQEDAPPVPALPKGSDMDAMMMKSKKSSRTHVHQPSHPPPPPFEEVVPLRDYPRDVKNRDIFYPPTPAKSVDPRRGSSFTTSSVTASSMIHTPSSGPATGLFSTDSVNTIGTESTGTGRRPLPVPPLPKNVPVSTHNFPPEKVGLSPPPTTKKPQEWRSSIAKRPLPPPDPPSG